MKQSLIEGHIGRKTSDGIMFKKVDKKQNHHRNE